MRKICFLLVVFCLLGVPRETFAYEVGYFRRFIGKECNITVQLTEQKKKVVTVYITGIDSSAGIVEGKINGGTVFIEASKVVLVVERTEGWQAVHNH